MLSRGKKENIATIKNARYSKHALGLWSIC